MTELEQQIATRLAGTDKIVIVCEEGAAFVILNLQMKRPEAIVQMLGELCNAVHQTVMSLAKLQESSPYSVPVAQFVADVQDAQRWAEQGQTEGSASLTDVANDNE